MRGCSSEGVKHPTDTAGLTIVILLYIHWHAHLPHTRSGVLQAQFLWTGSQDSRRHIYSRHPLPHARTALYRNGGM